MSEYIRKGYYIPAIVAVLCAAVLLLTLWLAHPGKAGQAAPHRGAVNVLADGQTGNGPPWPHGGVPDGPPWP